MAPAPSAPWSPFVPAAAPQRPDPCPRKRTIVFKTRDLELSLPLPGVCRPLSFGRAHDNDVVLHAQTLAEHHLALMPREDDVLAIGLVSGAFEVLGGASEQDCVCLREGDAISVGGVVLQLMAT